MIIMRIQDGLKTYPEDDSFMTASLTQTGKGGKVTQSSMKKNYEDAFQFPRTVGRAMIYFTPSNLILS